nr:MAG TPA: hypothetical protein [Caudoviricetes sp.]
MCHSYSSLIKISLGVKFPHIYSFLILLIMPYPYKSIPSSKRLFKELTHS